MADDMPALRLFPICEPCVRGEGRECHTPNCALWMHDVPPDGLNEVFGQDTSALAAVEALLETPAVRAAGGDDTEAFISVAALRAALSGGAS
jgi:hypothetical protein